jgi:hypothetical protein
MRTPKYTFTFIYAVISGAPHKIRANDGAGVAAMKQANSARRFAYPTRRFRLTEDNYCVPFCV